MKKLLRVLCLSLCMLAIPALASAVTVVNGSFEADTFGFSGTFGLGCANTLTGWTTQCSPDRIYPWGLKNTNVFNGGPTPYGKQWVIVGDFGNGGSWIQQMASGFTPGQDYLLNFALASEGEPANPHLSSLVAVSFPAGSSTATQTFAAPARGANFWDTWGSFSRTFTATASDVTFRFEGLAGSGFDAGIDNVSISGVTSAPEPGTVTLFGIGLVGLAGMIWKRKQSA